MVCICIMNSCSIGMKIKGKWRWSIVSGKVHTESYILLLFPRKKNILDWKSFLFLEQVFLFSLTCFPPSRILGSICPNHKPFPVTNPIRPHPIFRWWRHHYVINSISIELLPFVTPSRYFRRETETHRGLLSNDNSWKKRTIREKK